MRRTGLSAGLLAGLIATGCAMQPAGPAEAVSALRLTATPIEIPADELSGLRPLGAVRLSATHPAFGGFSGLMVEGERLLAVTDAGWLLEARVPDGDALRIRAAGLFPLPGESGSGPKSTSDAESLARSGEFLAIGFERDHRVELVANGRIAAAIRDARFAPMPSNSALEALAALPDGRLIAIGEAALDDAFPMFLLGPGGAVHASRLPQIGRHEVTGADIGPDGRLYLLRRDWNPIGGISVRIERYGLDPAGLPRPDTRETLAAFENASGIDNMEGIAVWRAAGGETRLAILSDDNFNPVQRTVLLQFAVLGSP